MQASTYLPYLAVIFLYSVVAIRFWRSVSQPIKQPKSSKHATLIALGLLIHASLLYQDVFIGDLNLNIANTLSLIFWLTVFIYWLADFKHELQSLQALVLPPAALTVALQANFHNNVIVAFANDPLFVWHISIALLAYSLFTFAALHALLMAAAERSLHQKTSFLKLTDFPPIMAMETLLFRIIGVGFFFRRFAESVSWRGKLP